MTREAFDAAIPAMMEYHQSIVLAMTAHVATTTSNLATRYLAAGLLSMDAEKAQIAARVFESHLVKTPEAQLTSWEKAFLADDAKMNELGQFTEHMPPVVLWRGHGRFARLFIFVATRFASCPDHVLDSEGVHATWKWIEALKRNLSFKSLNALLKLQSYLNAHGSFPDPQVLNPYLLQISSGLWHQGEAIRRDPSVALGDTWKALYATRFNLSAEQIELARQVVANDAPNAVLDPATAFSNYLRFLFEIDTFYSLDKVDPSVFFLVARTRAAPGRDAMHEAEAKGRKLAVVWFQKHAEAGGGAQVRPMAGRHGELDMRLHTIAEIAIAAGHYLATDHLDTEAAVEALYEQHFLSLEPLRYDSVRMGGPGHHWDYILSNPIDVESHAFDTRSINDLTKMALARALQIDEGSSDDLRSRRWLLSKDVLLAHLAHGPPAPAVPPARGGRGRARGRAKARGRGRGP